MDELHDLYWHILPVQALELGAGWTVALLTLLLRSNVRINVMDRAHPVVVETIGKVVVILLYRMMILLSSSRLFTRGYRYQHPQQYPSSSSVAAAADSINSCSHIRLLCHHLPDYSDHPHRQHHLKRPQQWQYDSCLPTPPAATHWLCLCKHQQQ